jgi:hypothetical protein
MMKMDMSFKYFGDRMRRILNSLNYEVNVIKQLRLPALMDLYIHPLYVLVSKILYSILNSLVPSILYIILYPLYSLWDRLVTLSKYIHV